MAKFTSIYASLILQDAKGVWAQFENGVFETTDSTVIKRLSKCEGVTEVKETAEAKEAKGADAPGTPDGA